jgi:hypothetical protein
METELHKRVLEYHANHRTNHMEIETVKKLFTVDE